MNEVYPFMKANMIRWGLAVLMLLAICFVLPAPGLAEFPALSEPGAPLQKSGWISDKEYQDETIHAVLENGTRKCKSSSTKVTTHWIRIKITDPAQLRTTLSNNSYEDQSLARARQMVKGLNSVVALNDDFAKYQYNTGHVARQGVVYRDAPDGNRDVLIIDDKGDFSYVLDATPETMAAKLEELAKDGRSVMHTFTFGPVLIADGVPMEVDRDATKYRKVEAPIACQRIAICQLGELEYGIVELDGGDGSGANIKELTDYILKLFPECKVAYNLDGGGSTNLYFGEKAIHKATRNHRAISGMIYFVSNAAEE